MIDELANEVDADAIFVVKSTVPPGTVSGLRKRLADVGSQARIVSHPEFLREGRAVEDFLAPDRIVIGAWEEEDADAVAELYASVDTQVVRTDPTSAEMIKYANNAYLATRLTFVNTLANVCEAVGADILDVVEGIGLDHRIGPHFLQPDPGMEAPASRRTLRPSSRLPATPDTTSSCFEPSSKPMKSNDAGLPRRCRQAAGGGLHGRRIAMWGVAFKAGTDDLRESPAVRIAALLQADGAEVVAYDPEASTDLVDDGARSIDGRHRRRRAAGRDRVAGVHHRGHGGGRPRHARSPGRRCSQPARSQGGAGRWAWIIGG